MIAIEKCPECRSYNIAHDISIGEIICHDCGLVLEDKMIKVEVPYQDNESGENRARDGIGSPLTNTQHDMGLATNIGNYSDISKLSSKHKYKFKRLQLWQYRTSISIERNLQFAMGEIKKVTSFIKVPSYVVEESARIYREAAFKGLCRGRATEVLVAASIYLACRNFEIPVSLEELVKAYDDSYTKKEIGKTFRIISRELGIKVMPQHPADCIPKICSKLKLSTLVQTHSIELLEAADKLGALSGRAPRSIAAAVIYISALINKEKRIQKEIADAAEITEVTLRNRYQDLVKILNILPKQKKRITPNHGQASKTINPGKREIIQHFKPKSRYQRFKEFLNNI